MVRKTLKFGVLPKARKYVLYSGKYITILMLHTHFFDLFFFSVFISYFKPLVPFSGHWALKF